MEKRLFSVWRLAAIAGVFGLLGILSYAVYGATTGTSDPKLGAGEQAVVVQRGDFSRQITVAGGLTFPASSSLFFSTAGTVGELLIQQGQAVEAGQVLATLDGVAVTTLTKGYAQAQRDLKAAQAALEEALESSDDAVRAYRSVFRKWLGIELTEAEQAMSPTELLASWGTDLRVLFDPEEHFRDIRRGWFANGIPVENPETRWSELVVYVWMNLTPGSIVGTCGPERAEIDGALCVEAEMNTAWRAVTGADADPYELDMLHADLTLAQAALEEAQTRLAGTALIAPMDGIVTRVAITQGGKIDAGTMAVRIIDPSVIELSDMVDQVDILYIQEGGIALVMLDALFGQTLEGVISSVASAPDEQSGNVSYAVKVRVDAPQGMVLREGLTGIARIVLSHEPNVLMVPVNAIRGTFQRPVVRVLDGNRIVERDVVLGESDDFWSVVHEGLREGDRVIISGQAPGGGNDWPSEPGIPGPRPGIPGGDPGFPTMPGPDGPVRPLPIPDGAEPDIIIDKPLDLR